MSGLKAIVLAAGEGTRMRSTTPKVLLPVAGIPMLCHPIRAALKAGATDVVVVTGRSSESIARCLAEQFPPEQFGTRIRTANQPQPLGTGDAVRCGLEALPSGDRGSVLILYGDVPAVSPAALQALVTPDIAEQPQLAMLTAVLDDPTGYGRIIRDGAGAVCAIREHRDCSRDELAVTEINPGIYLAQLPFLRDALTRLSRDNAQGELLLTDIVALAAAQGRVADRAWNFDDLGGVNTPLELAEVRARVYRAIARNHARTGVFFEDLSSVYIDADVVCAPGATLAPHVVLRGRTHIASGARIDVGAVLENVHVEADAHVLPYTVATDSRIGAGAQVGPFARLRPGSMLGPNTRVGNFVEMKATRLGAGSKAGHLSYLGDGEIGENVNIGAGTIFCNYDGTNKHTTTIEDHVFIGSDSQLVAPVRIGHGAYVASGTTVTRDVPPDALAISRPRQENKDGFAARLRARQKKRH